MVAIEEVATAGIGEYTAKTLALIYGSQPAHLRLYLVGRNRQAGEALVQQCSSLCHHGDFKFVPAQNLALIKDVDQVCEAIVKLEEESDAPRIDMLIMSQGQLYFGARRDTSEGLDKGLSLFYYSRIRITMNLLPLLKSASDTARVISVFAAGLETKLLQADLSLRDPQRYGVISRRSHTAYMTTMAFEHLAKDNPGISFVHTFPGVVVTPAYYNPTFPWLFKAIWFVLGPIVTRLVAISPEDNGARMLLVGTSRFPPRNGSKDDEQNIVTGTDDAVGSGSYAIGSDSNVANNGKASYPALREDGFEGFVWEHTTSAFEEIGAGKVFTG